MELLAAADRTALCPTTLWVPYQSLRIERNIETVWLMLKSSDIDGFYIEDKFGFHSDNSK